MANPRTSFFPLTHPNPEQKFVFDQPDEDIVTPLVPTGYRFDMKKVNIKQKPYDNYTAEQMQEIDKLIGRKSTTTTPVSNTMRNVLIIGIVAIIIIIIGFLVWLFLWRPKV